MRSIFHLGSKKKTKLYPSCLQITDDEFQKLGILAYKLENGLLKLVESLEQKREHGEWTDYLMVKETNAQHGNE